MYRGFSYQQQNMFRTDQIPLQILLQINHRRKVFVEMGNFPLIDSCLRIAYGHRMLESIAIRVSALEKRFRSTPNDDTNEMNVSRRPLSANTEQRKKYCKSCSALKFVQFQRISYVFSSPSLASIYARLARNKLNHI